MQVPAATVLMGQPLCDLGGRVCREVVQHDVHGQSSRHRGVDLLEEPSTSAPVWPLRSGEHLAGGHVHRGEQVDGAVALVVVGHRAGPAGFHRQRRLGAVQSLALGLLVEAEHHCSRRRIQVQANNVDQFLLERGSLLILNASTFQGFRL